MSLAQPENTQQSVLRTAPRNTQNAAFSGKIDTFCLSFVQTAGRSFVTNDGPIIPWCTGRWGFCRIFKLFRASSLYCSQAFFPSRPSAGIPLEENTLGDASQTPAVGQLVQQGYPA